MINYDRQMADIVSQTEGKPRLLLHACCAPCATAVIERLKPDFDLTVFWYNPNIAPRAEHDKRFSELMRLAAYHGLPLVSGEYDDAAFYRAAAGLESQREGGVRCSVCFSLRLKGAAEAAVKGGFDFFCTTLTVSPHKNAEAINRIGREAGEEAGVSFLPSDFKKRDGYKRSVSLCAELGIYRQNYCGCAFSLRVDSADTSDENP